MDMVKRIAVFIAASLAASDCADRPSYRTHPCIRDCRPGDARTCVYELHYEWIFTNGLECGDCLSTGNATDCAQPGCVIADGERKLINVYNRMMPGPMIQVCLGDRIVVDFFNEMADVATSVHWHGIHQRHTNWMDGVGGITQCPVNPEALFRYDFVADPEGTQFYHAHMGSQRVNGAVGPLIVKVPESSNPHAKLYDFDLAEHVISIQDWYRQGPDTIFYDEYRLGFIYDASNVSAILVNEYGYNGKNNGVIPARFNVKQNNRYRFRLLNVGSRVCPITVSIDGHNMTIISSDGFDLEPITVSNFTINVAERFDFVVDANQKEGSYWMLFNGSLDCGDTDGVAVLSYGEGDDLPTATRRSAGLEFNCINLPDDESNCLGFAEAKSVNTLSAGLQGNATFKYYLTFDVQAVTCGGGLNVTAPTVNNILMTIPSKPLIENAGNFTFCNNENRSSCVSDPSCSETCHCVHVVKIPLNSIVEIIMIDACNPDFELSHPIHLHGYGFSVLGQDKLSATLTMDRVKQLDSERKLPRNLDNPPVKDTISIPCGGYVILRFLADNPGFWLMHCHVEHHFAAGMGLAFKVGDDFQAPPNNFPTCGDFSG